MKQPNLKAIMLHFSMSASFSHLVKRDIIRALLHSVTCTCYCTASDGSLGGGSTDCCLGVFWWVRKGNKKSMESLQTWYALSRQHYSALIWTADGSRAFWKSPLEVSCHKACQPEKKSAALETSHLGESQVRLTAVTVDLITPKG